MGERIEGAGSPANDREWSPLVGIAFFCLSIVLCSMGVERLMPYPDSFREKLLLFSQTKDDYDLVFFGASDTHWGLSPQVFDERIATHGVRLKSFNLGVPGANGYETNQVIRTVMALRPDRLRYAVIAWRPWRLERDPNRSRREVWWHTFPNTIVLFRGLWLDPLPLREKIQQARDHGQLCLQNFLHLGLGPSLMDAFQNRVGPGTGKWDYLSTTGGFEGLSLDDPGRFWPEGPLEREMFLDNLDLFQEWTREQARLIRELEAHDRDAVPDYLSALYPRTVYSTTLQVEQLRAQGIEPIYLIPPSHAHDKIQRRLAVEGYLPTLLDFNNPERYPDLFNVAQRFDDEHFTDEGARIYSRIVADHVADVLIRIGTSDSRERSDE